MPLGVVSSADVILFLVAIFPCQAQMAVLDGTNLVGYSYGKPGRTSCNELYLRS